MRVIYRTASKKRLLSVPLCPGSLGLRRQGGSILALSASVSTTEYTCAECIAFLHAFKVDSQQPLSANGGRRERTDQSPPDA